eukprot:6408344-Prymnesium_polylepis.1
MNCPHREYSIANVLEQHLCKLPLLLWRTMHLPSGSLALVLSDACVWSNRPWRGEQLGSSSIVTSIERITGRSEVMKAHSPIALATSSNFSTVQKVWPENARERT